MVCDLGTKHYNRFLFSMLQRLRGNGLSTRSLIQELLLAPGVPLAISFNDKKFSQALLQNPVYETTKPTRCTMVLSATDR